MKELYSTIIESNTNKFYDVMFCFSESGYSTDGVALTAVMKSDSSSEVSLCLLDYAKIFGVLSSSSHRNISCTGKYAETSTYLTCECNIAKLRYVKSIVQHIYFINFIIFLDSKL